MFTKCLYKLLLAKPFGEPAKRGGQGFTPARMRVENELPALAAACGPKTAFEELSVFKHSTREGACDRDTTFTPMFLHVL